jgi:RNA polymerase sigma factor (sigma-70 family)
MVERPTAGRRFGSHFRLVAAVTDDAASAWFVREIVPLEPKLMLYLRHNWRNASDVPDLRQEIYARVLQAARQGIPANPENFLFVCARNLLIDFVRRKQIVPIDTFADLDVLGLQSESPSADRLAMEHEDLRRLEAAMAALPKRTREAIALAYFEGLNRTQIADRMGVSQRTAAEFVARGTIILAELLSDTPATSRSKS